MSRWFRFYADAIRNPKVAKLNDGQFRLWVELLAVATDNDGLIPPLDDLKHILKRRLDHLSRGVKDLLNSGLMDALGDGYEPHNWGKFQYKSDTSTDRVKTLRAKRNVSTAVSETPPDTETEQSIPLPNGNGANSDKVFWDLAKAYISDETKNPGALVGKWASQYGKPSTAEAITRAQLERPVQKISFIQGCLKAKARDPARLEFGPC